MNMNELARELCKREGLKKQINVAQCKEFLKCLAELMAEPDHKGSLTYLRYIAQKFWERAGKPKKIRKAKKK